MKSSHINKVLVLGLLVCISSSVFAQKRRQKEADKDTYEWAYDIECYGGTAKNGYKLVKVWTYSKEKSIASTQAKKNAVHGIIFKGYAGIDRECRASRPLMNRDMTEEEYEDFFKDFFLNDGEFNRFVTYATDHEGIADVQRLMKNRKGKKDKLFAYKIGVIVSVASDDLRKFLEKNDIINSLAKGF